MEVIRKGKWIRSKQDYGDAATLFGYDFDTADNVESARLYITAMGVYNAYINGNRVGNFVMAPGWTAYEKRHQYQVYDITDLLNTRNRIEVSVGKGWYRGRLVTWSNTNIWGAFSALIAVIEVVYKDGNIQYFRTNRGEWKTAPAPVKFSEIYDGETYDATYVPEKWEESVTLHASKDVLIPQEGLFVTEQERIKPVKVLTTPKGETVIDFGQNMTGYAEFSVDGKIGDKIIYTHAETLDADGNFYTDNLRTAKQRVEYVCREGKQTYKPQHTFMGFRYIRLDSAPPYLNPMDFTAVEVHSDMKRIGYFKCSDEKINKLYENVIWGQKDNFLDVPTDCPQRDERLGWTGDAQVFVKTATYNFDVRLFFEKWLKDLAAEQETHGFVPFVVPSVIDEDEPSAAWGDAAVICPWQIYVTYGDKQVLADQIESMKAWVDYIHAYGDEEYLWIGGEHFGDWLGLDAEEGSYKGISDTDMIASAYFAYSAGIVAKALNVLGEDSAYYSDMYRKIKEAFNKRFTEFKTQTECAIVLYFDIVPNKREVADKLAQMVKANGNKLQTGFIGTPYILEALSQNGYADIAYSLLLQEEYPSWLFSVNMGATTIWEHWDGMKSDGTMWSTDMNSFNHYAYGAVASWMYETIAGIRPDERKPGFENIILTPTPDLRLDWAEATIETKYGTVGSKWIRKNGVTEYEFKIPSKAVLKLDGKEIILDKGIHRFTV